MEHPPVAAFDTPVKVKVPLLVAVPPGVVTVMVPEKPQAHRGGDRAWH